MKKIFYTLFLLMTSTFLMAVNTAVGLTPTAGTVITNITPTAEPTSVPIQAEQGKNVFGGGTSKIVFDIKSAYKEDGTGQLYTSELGIKAKQTLFNNFLADVYIRFIKPMSNENTPVITELLTAKFQYVNNFFSVVLGRVELTKTISALNYFGPYSTAGQRYLDLVGISIPFYLTAGVPEIEQINLPTISFSAYYFPAMLNLTNTTYNGLQEFYLLQLRLNTILWDNPMQVMLNVGKGTSEYFTYSILSGKAVVDFSVSIDLFKHYKANFSAGVLNTDKTNQTSVIAAGLELHDFREWIVVLDKLIFEVQIPLGNVTSEFEPESMSWFATVCNKIGNFRYGVAATTAANDYTFRNVVSYKPGFTGPFGSGNVYAPEGLSLEKRGEGETKPALYVYIAHEF